MAIESKLPVRVYIEDTDAGGVVYHANYVRYCERARTEMLRELGMEQRDTLAAGSAFVVHSMQLKFLRPAQVDDLLTVASRVARVRAASIVFEQEVRLPDGQPACQAQVTIACVHRDSLRAKRMPGDLIERLTAREAGAS